MSKFWEPRTCCPQVGSGRPPGSAPGQCPQGAGAAPTGEGAGAAQLEADASGRPGFRLCLIWRQSSARVRCLAQLQLLTVAPPLRLFLGPETYVGSPLLPVSTDCWP